MDFFITIFNEALYRPIFNFLIFVYNVIPGRDFGIAIIIVTILLRILLFPLAHKALKSQKALQELQPKIKEMQGKIKNKEEQAKKLLEFYKENKINPFSGCLPILIQLPILIALYRVFLHGLDPSSLDALYPFIQNPGTINPTFLSIIDLSKPNYWLAILAGVSQYIQSKATFQKKDKPGQGMLNSDFSKSMTMSFLYVMPVFLVVISWKLPAGLPLYWVITMLFSWGQQVIVNKGFKKTLSTVDK
ncbi:MAG: hypothetical protein A3B96_02470 [Candidatus Spechtbacteria bacterium RIFCSPHIGHO2_02_FULL_43_15b]|uniref:Membrane insertase YidC/Oxa/ALB C-terminal domain-containing protein n=1 Tax=Candidatus Spechtbacteria bacterium RIFCSPHIGHO2_01_FULL_43_30 TaxID=1802158 RepID=A0A1G2H6J4_9BACT|nr:MAG: hypothetical protein A2827_02625 [Candidatus Spechtbacteria bacterium RIFCSPHIGHO2_01_FULL_43_30]OGZ60165.1 MAG: hypothetical protein A3B96_02470 [Candidatus Spechtbacteria bacterium RIFCSPHIGHO2_02_FULL_43_15b]